MATGYDEGGATPRLICLGDYFDPVLDDPGIPECAWLSHARLNFMSTGFGTTHLRDWAGGGIVYYETAALGLNTDWSWEAWLHPRLGITDYGADEPVVGVWQGSVNSCVPAVDWHSAAEHFWPIFRQGAGIGVGYVHTTVRTYNELVIPFPANMDQWFHIVCNVYRSGAGADTMYAWVNGLYIGQVAMNTGAAVGLCRVEVHHAGLTNYNNTTPVIGALAAHGRQMTTAEIHAAHISGTVAVLGDTRYAVDIKDTAFNGGITCAMPPTIAGPTQILPDANLGDGALDGFSPMTFYGVDHNWGAAEPRQVGADRSGNYVHWAAVEGATGYMFRFGWFDGR